MECAAALAKGVKEDHRVTSRESGGVKPFAPLMEVEKIDEEEKKTHQEECCQNPLPPPENRKLSQETEPTVKSLPPVKISSGLQLEKQIGAMITSTEEKGITRSVISFKHSPLSTTHLEVEVEYYDTAPDSYRIAIKTESANLEQMQPLYDALQAHLSKTLSDKQLIFLPASLIEPDRMATWRRSKMESRKKIDCENRSSRLSSDQEGEPWLTS